MKCSIKPSDIAGITNVFSSIINTVTIAAYISCVFYECIVWWNEQLNVPRQHLVGRLVGLIKEHRNKNFQRN